ncbi:MAG: OadG family protein [Mogibacterium sp.]|nr:OadG family protein [Mogibacterium sp.]
MTIQEILKIAAIDTVLGMGTVFAVLIIISLCIWALGEAFKDKKPAAAGAAVAATAAAAAKPTAGDDSMDVEIAAVISAAISQFIRNQYGEEVDEGNYIVRNIRRATWKHIS